MTWFADCCLFLLVQFSVKLTQKSPPPTWSCFTLPLGWGRVGLLSMWASVETSRSKSFHLSSHSLCLVVSRGLLVPFSRENRESVREPNSGGESSHFSTLPSRYFQTTTSTGRVLYSVRTSGGLAGVGGGTERSTRWGGCV